MQYTFLNLSFVNEMQFNSRSRYPIMYPLYIEKGAMSKSESEITE